MEFDVILNCYSKNTSSEFERCIDSIKAQTRLPENLIIVADGELSSALWSSIEKVIEEISQFEVILSCTGPICIGLGPARNLGFACVSSPLFAVMDCDDEACIDRFNRQVSVFASNETVDVVGGFIKEVGLKKSYVRRVPTNDSDIMSFIKFRSPMNHVTCMFRSSSFELVDGYRDMRYVEDYDLFVRMIACGLRLFNINQVLVNVHIGIGGYERRRSLEKLGSEIRLGRTLYSFGLVNVFEFITFVLIKTIIVIAPLSIIKLIYEKILRS